MRKNLLNTLLYSFVFLNTCFINASAQSIITIGTGTSSNTNTIYPAPYGNYYWGAKHQILILASELTAQGMLSGNITALSFNVKVKQGTPLENFTIKLKSTTDAILNTTWDNVGLTTVYGPVTFTESAGWNPHTFVTPFFWDGVSNILIETCFNNGSYIKNAEMYYTNPGFASVRYYRGDNANVCPTPGTATTSSNRPNMQLEYQPSTIPPVANFFANQTLTCGGMVVFTNKTFALMDTAIWNFGDGKQDTLLNKSPIMHVYNNVPGPYSVTLTAINQYGIDDTTIIITVDTMPAGLNAASCLPIDTTYCCNYGIYNVTFNTINRTTANGSEGYRDYSCTDVTTVTEGKRYLLSVQTNSSTPENVRAWIDFNKDGIFDNTDELIFLSDNKTQFHSDSIKIRSGAVVDSALRMRIASDSASSPVPTPCGNAKYGQHEDYTVKILPNTNPPVADFIIDKSNICTSYPTINFTDKTVNLVSTWIWDFGDGNSDTTKNPSHDYTVPGLYTVTLKVVNAFGNDSIIKTNLIVVSAGPKPANCLPLTTSYCCGVGIYKVTFGTIVNTTPDASEGYKDYSCTMMSTVSEGKFYSITVQTNSFAGEHVRAWIDFNNNGVFNDTTELVFSSTALQNHNGSIFIPTTAVKDSTLRLRVASEIDGLTAPKACSNVELGQHEDYGIIVQAAALPPAANFKAHDTISCSGAAVFTDLSLNAPNKWLWNFGDGTTDTISNPVHYYTKDSTYTVKLIVFNTFGSDSITKTNIIKITIGNNPVNPSCTPSTISYCCGYGIYNMNFGTINNTTTNASEGYRDFSCALRTEVTEGTNNSISFVTSSTNPQDTKVWVDLNNNGSFDPVSELVFTAIDSVNPNGLAYIPGGAVLDTILRMRVASDYNGSNPSPCSFMQYGQMEDYGIIIRPNLNPPVADFIVDKSITCGGTINFTDKSVGVVKKWFWDFGDGFTDTVQNPSHSYSSATASYSVKLIVINDNGSDTIAKTNIITVTCDFIVGTGISSNTTSSYPAPYGNYYWGAKHQFLIKASELKNIGITQSGDITSLGFNVLLPKGTELVDFTIKMAKTLDSNLSATFLSSGFTTVFGPSKYIDVTGWNTHVFTTPFTWDGLSNIIVETCFNNASYTQNAMTYYTLTPFNSSVYFNADNLTVCANTSGTVSMNRPNMKLGFLGPSPIADFSLSDTLFCNGTITFKDSTIYANSWIWKFGDGTSSNLQNPTHTYAASGIYTVTMIASNAFGSDTVVKNNLVTIDFSSSPKQTSCIPNTISNCCGYGIYKFTLDTFINNTTSSGAEKYKDFSCRHIADLSEDLTYPFTIDINPDTSYLQDIKIYIDLNNDATFDEAKELFYYFKNIKKSVSGTLFFSSDSSFVADSLLRLRIVSDFTGSILLNACNNIQFGQAEDYGIILRKTTNLPVVDFTVADTTLINCGDSIQFIDKSLYATKWEWDFGDGKGDSIKNPSHVYTDAGSYTVTLTAYNKIGANSKTITNYITVDCQILMPTTNSKLISSCVGKLFDSGGASDYQNNTDGISTISIPGATSITLSFASFNFDAANDYLYVYDGIDTSSALIGKFTGTALPNSGTIISSGDALTLRQQTNSTVTASGFELNWKCENTPVADFLYQYLDTCGRVIKFVDLSTKNPTSWLWNFGDGTTSSTPSPTHVFSSGVTYIVTLIVSNFYGSDTITKAFTSYAITSSFTASSYNVDLLVSGDVIFTDNSTGAISWLWDFGDGGTSSSQNPLHTFTQVGNFNVSLNVSNGLCNHQASQVIIVSKNIGMLENVDANTQLKIYPNPTKNNITIDYQFSGKKNITFSLVDVMGKILISGNKLCESKFNKNLNLSNYPKGIYCLKLFSDDKQITRTIILQ